VKAGHDGVISSDMVKNQRWSEVMVLDAKQIKSATGNKGTFSPSSAKLTESADWQARAKQLAESMWSGYGKPIRETQDGNASV